MRSGATPAEQQVRDAVRERAGLARAGARDHEQRARAHAAARSALAVGHGISLRRIERREGGVGNGRHGVTAL